MLPMIMLVAAAASAPTYLKCTLDGAKGPFPISVAADEAAQAATLTIEQTGHVIRRPAVFTATKLTIVDQIGVATMTYTIDRVNLGITRDLTVGGKNYPETGVCTVETVTKRAF